MDDRFIPQLPALYSRPVFLRHARVGLCWSALSFEEWLGPLLIEVFQYRSQLRYQVWDRVLND